MCVYVYVYVCVYVYAYVYVCICMCMAYSGVCVIEHRIIFQYVVCISRSRGVTSSGLMTREREFIFFVNIS